MRFQAGREFIFLFKINLPQGVPSGAGKRLQSPVWPPFYQRVHETKPLCVLPAGLTMISLYRMRVRLGPLHFCSQVPRTQPP